MDFFIVEKIMVYNLSGVLEFKNPDKLPSTADNIVFK